MLSAIVFAVAGIWLLALVLVLALCNDAKAGDAAMEVACGRSPANDAEPVVVEPAVCRRERDARHLARLA